MKTKIMVLRGNIRKKISALSIFFMIFVSTLLIFSFSHIQNNNTVLYDDDRFTFNDLKNPQLGAQEILTIEWLENPTFEDPVNPWYSEMEGDLSDIQATTGSGEANFHVLGNSGVQNIHDLSDTNWTAFNNPEFPIEPSDHGINGSGCWITHTWNENIDQSLNTPSIHWKRNVTMQVNMSDYIITSASLETNYSAFVQALDHDGGGVEVPGDYTEGQIPGVDTQFGIGDFVTFYVEISDTKNSFSYRIASNKTKNLGQDGLPSQNNVIITNHTHVPLNVISEDLLISYLTACLQNDHYNFTITLGIDIYCEDNEYNVDIDRFKLLAIEAFNLTFSYEKKINQFNTVSWKQDGDKISDISNDTIIINQAKLNFKYHANYNWTDEASNSEIQVFINNNKVSKTIKLLSIEANNIYQFTSTDGFDITSLIPYNTVINFSIQLSLTDKPFPLDKNITFTIDDVYLNISYTVEFPDYQTNLQVYFNGVNKTISPLYNHPVGYDLNITVKYPDDSGNHISGAVVELSGNLTGTLIENEILKQYTIIIDANDLDVGTYYIKIIAHKINYKISKISPVITVLPYISQDLQLFLNGENQTSNPSFDISLDKLLNITIKYCTNFGTPVTGASVVLTGEGILENLNESSSFNQYSVIMNTTKQFKEGNNPLTITASKLNYETKFKYPRINVRKINSLITPVNNTNTISIKPGGDALIQVYINNTDFDELIKGANVTLSCEFKGSKSLEDPDNDGIYEYNLTDIPAGTHKITINAYGADKYNFVSLEIIVAAIPPANNSFIFRILLTIAAIASIALAGYVYAYQKVLKFPRAVRKVRKYRRTLRKAKEPKISIFDRKKAFDNVYQKEISATSRFLKVKMKKEGKEEESPEKLIKQAPEDSVFHKDERQTSQNTNSYNLNKKNKDKIKTQESFRRRLSIYLKRRWTGSFRMNNMRRFLFIIIILTSITLFSFIINPHFGQNSINFSEKSTNIIDNENLGNLCLSAQDSFTKQWLNNTSFDDPIQPTWFPSYGELGDNSDVKAVPGTGQVNYTIIGNSGIKHIDETLNDSDWKAYNNPELPILPDIYEINSSGCYVSHEWDEDVNQTRNRPSVQWKRVIEMPVNMTDYNITSASLEVIFNATVTVSPWYAGGIDREFDNGLDVFSTGDYVKFYVLLSDDAETIQPVQIAYNNTGEGELGQDSPSIGDFSDSQLYTIPENVLIDVLTTMLEKDGYNFTITLGIDIYCEDNEIGVDVDRWDELIIRSFNLTFTYEKKINQYTSVSWNQDADSVNSLRRNENETVIVDEAILNFKYKSDQNWTSISPNSEIRILINDNLHPETVKLSYANDSFEDAKPEGFDVTPLITDYVNLSIQVFIADEFGLDHNITISIDEVILNISYSIIFEDYPTNLNLFLNDYNATLDPTPTANINIGESLNITINYLNATTGFHIPNATVSLSGNFTGTLDEDEILEQYTIILNSDLSDAGINFVTITAQAENHQTKEVIVQINVDKFSSSNMQIFLNNQDVSSDPYIELIKNEILNISVKYKTLGGTHISGASVLLTSQTYSSYLTENVSLENYYLIINTTDRLDVGNHFFTIEAQSDTYKTQTEEISVSIRKINLEIIPESGLNTIETRTGESIWLRVKINNTDFGGDILGALVTYSWEKGSGILTDENNDGIYDDPIPDFPEGTYEIKISAQVGDDYYIEDYEIYASATSEVAPENIIFQILLGVSIAIFSGLVIYLYAYYTYLKFPKQVRKIRKYRKTLNRKSPPTVSIMDRESAFKKKYSTELGKTSKIGVRPKFKKPSSSEQEPIGGMTIEKPIEQKVLAEKLIKEAVEKKEELDKLVDESIDKNK